MAHDSDHKTSAELQREVEQQRNRLEDRIDQIQDKLSPGQLMDEVLAYTKGGGGEIASNLQRQITSNPLPVALLGVSLAWLIAKPQGTASSQTSYDRDWDSSINRSRGYATGAGDDYADDYVDDYDYDEVEYPLATVSGTSIRRLGDTSDEGGNRFTEFADDTGRKFKAATDAMGRRAGHFRDDAGNTYRGFSDSTGSQIQHFKDEAGNLLDEASGWASATWRKARERLHDAQHAIGSGTGAARRGVMSAGGALGGHASHAGSAIGSRAYQAGGAIQGGAGQLGQTLVSQFRDQPLVAGALAFAVGAALAAALPKTAQEDAVLGDASDKLKAKAGEQANQLYEQGRDRAAEVYGKATEKVGEVYQQTKEGLSGATAGTSEISNG